MKDQPLLIRQFVMCFVLVLTVLFVYSPVFQANFQSWDDPSHTFEQVQVAKGGFNAIREVFITPDNVLNTYVPLTVTSFILEKMIFGLSAFSAHTINLLLHCSVVFLLLVFGRLMGLSFIASFTASVLFALHPMHVESVAWVSERKDVLYSVFYVLALIFYCQYLKTGRGLFYIYALLMAVLSLFSKAMALSLPLILILIDWMKGRSFSWKVCWEKVPFFLVVGLVAGITYLMNTRSTAWLFPDSLLIWLWSGFFYLSSFLVPVSFIPLYGPPMPLSGHNMAYLVPLAGVISIAILLVFFRGFKWLLFAVFFYVLSAFFLWRFDVFDNTIVADRFMYLPSAGFCFLIGYIVQRLLIKHKTQKYLLAFFGLGVVFLLIVSCYKQVSYWQNSWKLWTHELTVRPDLYYAQFMRYQALLDDSSYKKVSPDFEQYVYHRLPTKPTTQAHFNKVRAKMHFFRAISGMKYHARELKLGLWRTGEFQRIPIDFIYSSYAGAYLLIKDHPRYLLFLQKALNRGPVRKSELMNLANYYFVTNNYPETLGIYNKILSYDPANYDIILARGAIYAQLGDNGAALNDALKLLQINAQDPRAYDLLFNTFIAMNHLAEAEAVLNRELKLWPAQPQTSLHQVTLMRTSGSQSQANAAVYTP